MKVKYTEMRLLCDYAGQWVARVNQTVVASGDTIIKARRAAEKAGYSDPVFMFVPKHSGRYIPSFR